eukprot:15471865-Alexandrium_andersonii.AAC.1
MQQGHGEEGPCPGLASQWLSAQSRALRAAVYASAPSSARTVTESAASQERQRGGYKWVTGGVGRGGACRPSSGVHGEYCPKSAS